MAKLSRDPFIHFLVLGGLIFLCARLISGGDDGGQTIVITQADVTRLETMWTSQMDRPPSDDERKSLVQNHIEEEVLYREALKLDLGDEDLIIRRRLVQKYLFLLEGLLEAPEPTEDELAAFLEENKDRYLVPARVSFRHIYFSQPTDEARARAEASLWMLQDTESEGNWRELGDAFMMAREFAGQDRRQIAANFGTGFSDQILLAENGGWSGPLLSAYGWHLVQIIDRKKGRAPALADILSEVEEDFRGNQLREASLEARANLRETYKNHTTKKRTGRMNRACLTSTFMLVLLALILPFAPVAYGHEIKPALLGIAETETPNLYDVKWKVPIREGVKLNLDPIFPDHCEISTRGFSERSTLAFEERWALTCEGASLDGHDIHIAGLDSSVADVFVETAALDGTSGTFVLRSDRTTLTVDFRLVGLWEIISFLASNIC